METIRLPLVKEGNAESKEQIAWTDEAEPGTECPQGHGEVKRCMTGWLNYYAIASLKQRMQEWDEWLRRRIRTYIWKQWKKPRIKFRNLIKLGVPECFARMVAYSGRGYWFTEKTRSVTRATTNERLIRTGYFELSLTYESIQTAYIGRAVCLTVRRGLVTQCY